MDALAAPAMSAHLALTPAQRDAARLFSPSFQYSGLRQAAPLGARLAAPENGQRKARCLQVKAMVVEAPKVGTKTTLHKLWDEHRQSPWYDNLKRPISDLQKQIDIGIRGVTSNPTIFQKAIMGSDKYDADFKKLLESGKSVEEAYWSVVVDDIVAAADLFRPIYDSCDGLDGYISVEVSPKLAHEKEATVASAKELHARVDRPNVYIKIPATVECVPAIEDVIAAGISVNVTLIFSDPRYEEVAEAYIAGLERAEADLSKISSVASFFVSRVDVLVDKKLAALGTDEAKAFLGKAAIAQSKLAYELYKKKFSGPRWEALVKRGAKPQRLLWASTGVKDPKYPDTLYIDSLIGPDTVNTMPDAAVEAFYDHGHVSRTIDVGMDEARSVYDKVEALGIKWEDTRAQLEDEGVASFKKSFEDLLAELSHKASALVN